MMDRAAVLWHLDALEPLRKSFRYVFLKKARRDDATVITLHRNRSPAQVRQHQRRNHLVVRRQLALRDSLTRKQNLVRMRDHSDRQRQANVDGVVYRVRSTQ